MRQTAGAAKRPEEGRSSLTTRISSRECGPEGVSRRARLRSAGAFFAIALVWACLGSAPAAGGSDVRDVPELSMHIAFTSRLFSDVNESDAKAAVKVWAEAWASDHRFRIEPVPQVITGPSAIAQAVREARTDFFSLTTDEYLSLESEVHQPKLIVSLIGGQDREEYLLLVRVDSGIADLRGLEGRSVNVFENARTSLSSYWLDALLLDHGLPPAEDYFGHVNHPTKLSGAVLPVFSGRRMPAWSRATGWRI